MNSIQPFRDRVYVNSRETWQSYYVNRNGSIEWMIDGATGGDFGPLPDEGRFVRSFLFPPSCLTAS